MPDDLSKRSVQIRLFRPSDADALAAIFHASVRKAGLHDYSPEQVAAWSPAAPERAYFLRKAEQRSVFVAVDAADIPVGYGTLEPDGHIDHLYCRWDLVGNGIGSALYAALEASAKGHGIKVLFVEASEAARRLFERRGFAVEIRSDFLLRGVLIHHYRMAKVID